MKQDKGTKINNNTRLKMLDRAIKSYKAQRLRLQADEIMRENIQENDLRTRMRTAYNKNKHKIKNAEPDKKNNTRQRKIDDLQNRPHSWKGLRERQSNAMKRQEEYDYEEPRFNMFAKYTWEQVCDAMETMSEKELDELMDICDVGNIDDLYEYVATCFALEE